ncbi:MAG: hypothetical protein CL920_10245 [Deltaproteobacteria bacterium]|nr:hypothetical protein [Deltaproteobacteria bacterium]|tara:strand:- start:17102 stop:17902 length:801 start_codon:yes stop_codon:yes gene_type:complete
MEKEVLIVVKAYPNPSRSLIEASCVVGISRDGQFIRLYPIPFRQLEFQERFRKYQWIKLQVETPRTDRRPESFRPQLNTMKVLGKPLSTHRNWKPRRDVIMPLCSNSLCDIQDAQKTDRTSIGLFRPAEILDFDWEPEKPPHWTPAELDRLRQEDMFLPSPENILEKIPYTFRYRFRCEGCRNKEPHYMKIVDWELGMLFRRMQQECSTIEEALAKVRQKWFGDLCGPDKDTHFFVGNMGAHPTSFLILGVFWPPVQQESPQMSLF